ncbi:MAG: ATP synthase F0 subunit B [Deltaproteobacteria bacterium]|nr:MAG: ATP synthase F0 subunit B [Deltaproteobacteria bacterium]
MAISPALVNSLVGMLAGSAQAEGEHFSLMSVHPGTIIWTIIIFLLLLVILTKLVWKPLLKVVSDRENRIREDLERAEQAKAEAEKALEEQKQALEQQRKEASEFIARAKEEAQAMREQLLEKARQEAEEILQRTRRQLDEEKNRAIGEVKKYVVELAVDAAGHLLSKSLDDETHRRMVQQYIDGVAAALSERH